MKIKTTIISGKSLKDILEQVSRIADKIEEKENKSYTRILIDTLKRPVIGKKK